MKVLALFPEFVERYYSNGLYLYLSKISRIVLGWIPFSVGDLFYTILFFFIFRWIYKNRIGFFKNWKITFCRYFIGNNPHQTIGRNVSGTSAKHDSGWCNPENEFSISSIDAIGKYV